MGSIKQVVRRTGLFLANPMMAKLDKVNDHDNTQMSVSGITWKTIFLLIITGLGFVIFHYTKGVLSQSMEICLVIGGLIVACLLPIISYKFVRSSCILGTIYSFIQGYAYAFLINLLGSEYAYPALFALVLTFAVVLVMTLLYQMRIIRLNHKIISAMATTVVVVFIFWLLLTLLKDVTVCKNIIAYFTQYQGIYLFSSIIGVLFASAFLFVDFEILHNAVKNKLSKKYEWLGAFSLSFAIIDLYGKILDLVLKLVDKTEKN